MKLTMTWRPRKRSCPTTCEWAWERVPKPLSGTMPGTTGLNSCLKLGTARAAACTTPSNTHES
eukprot:766151-Pelagomonas_calceolata.AAC.2